MSDKVKSVQTKSPASGGVISQVIGPVVDIHFESDVPEVFTALTIAKPDGTTLTLEVQQQLKGSLIDVHDNTPQKTLQQTKSGY